MHTWLWASWARARSPCLWAFALAVPSTRNAVSPGHRVAGSWVSFRSQLTCYLGKLLSPAHSILGVYKSSSHQLPSSEVILFITSHGSYFIGAWWIHLSMNSACLFVKFIEWKSILHNSFIQQIFFEYFYMPNTAPGAGEPAANWLTKSILS